MVVISPLKSSSMADAATEMIARSFVRKYIAAHNAITPSNWLLVRVNCIIEVFFFAIVILNP
ncbi:hypothetical protein GL2_31640 [Microbulbifer sp. GL-2]|nr:hypothetical protein GL2_31640 [Microbulbifer sp. GL-2]